MSNKSDQKSILDPTQPKSFFEMAASFFRSEPKEVQELTERLTNNIKMLWNIERLLNDTDKEIKSIAVLEVSLLLESILADQKKLNGYLQQGEIHSDKTKAQIQAINENISQIMFNQDFLKVINIKKTEPETNTAMKELDLTPRK